MVTYIGSAPPGLCISFWHKASFTCSAYSCWSNCYNTPPYLHEVRTVLGSPGHIERRPRRTSGGEILCRSYRIHSAQLFSPAAFRAAFGFIGVTLGNEEFLLTCGEGESFAAIGTSNRFVCETHRMASLFFNYYWVRVGAIQDLIN